MTEENQDITRDPILETEEMKKMFVGGIAPDSKEEDIKKYFEELSGGDVTVQTISRKEDKEKKSHFCFVTLATSEAVDEVLLNKKDLNFNGRKLDINRAVPKNNTSPGAHEKTKKLFVANLPKFNCSEDDLMKYFEARHPKKYGEIESVQLIKKKDDSGNKTEENKGYGFVIVSTEDMADKMAIQHSFFEFGGRRVELKKSVPTTEPRGRGGKGRGGGRGGGNQQGYGNYYGNQQQYGYQPYQDWGGYDQWYGYGQGYPQQQYQQAPAGRGRGGKPGGGNRFQPY